MTPRLPRWRGAQLPAPPPSCPPARADLRRGLPAGRPGVPADLGRPVRRRPGDVRAALQHPATAAGARPGLPPVGRPERAVGVAVHRRPRPGPARGRPGLRGPRPDGADPRLAVELGGGRAAVRGGAELAGAAGAARAARDHPRRPAGRCRGLPARGGARGQPRQGDRPLHRRHRPRRDGRAPGRRRAGRPRRLAAGARRHRGARPGLRRPGPVAAAGLTPLRRRAVASAGPARHDRPAASASRRCWPSTASPRR